MTNKEERVLQHLAKFVSEHKKEYIEKVLNDRTRNLTVVLENIYQSQNASAVLRTSECMGIQDIHIVENTAKYYLNVRVLKGADKWLNLERYQKPSVNNTQTCFERLRKDGYKILVADPSPDGLSIDDVDVSQNKIALVFGNELNGASEYSIQNADNKVRIPMYGFTESLNISVSVAICLNSMLTRLRMSGVDMHLSESEKQELRLSWFRKIVKRSDLMEREFLRTIE